MEQTLQRLTAGTRVRLVRYSADNDFTRRLSELGLVPGTLFTYVRRAPLGGPMEVLFGQTRLAIRPSRNVDIVVETLQ
ncbi:MAG: ferrous iron transport protein A [Candidatus Kapaibacterium sp.]